MRVLFGMMILACAMVPVAMSGHSSMPLALAASPTGAPVAGPTASPAPAVAPSATAATPAPGPSPTTAITMRAKDWLHRVQTNNIDRSQLDAQMNSALTDAIAKQVAGQLGALGDPTAFTFVDSRVVQGNTIYSYRANFKSGAIIWTFAVNDAGKITGLFARPVQ